MLIETWVKQSQTPLLELAGTLSEDIKTKKIALTALSVLSATFACGAVSAALVGAIPISGALLSLPLLTLAFLSFKASECLKDYEDPLELQRMKEEAKHMTFSEIFHEYSGIEDVLLHGIVSFLELRSKFRMEYEKKPLADTMKEVTIGYIKKHNLMTKDEIKKLFSDELAKRNNVRELYASLEEIGMEELKRFDIISSKEHAAFENLLASEEETESLNQSAQLRLSTQFFGRRESVLEDLDRREKKEREEIQKVLSNKKTTSASALRGLQRQLKAIQEEKARVQTQESIGLDLQLEYKQYEEELRSEYESRTEELQTQFNQLKLVSL